MTPGEPSSNRASPLVRPYVLTGGRTADEVVMPPETLVRATGRSPAASFSAPSAAALSALREGISGPVFEPGDEGFAVEQAGSFGAPAHRPLAVVGARTSDDVRSAVEFAAEHGLPVAVQSTGHGNLSNTDGALLISTRRMRRLEIDRRQRSVKVAAGVIWRDVIDEAAPYRLAPVCGSAPSVGVIGYTLGGGLSPLGRTYGFSADYVRKIEVVTADGYRRLVDGDHEPDLFWAMRGGKGNFGVVTAMEFGLVDEPELYGGGLYYDGKDAEAVLRSYVRWAPLLPATMTTSIALLGSTAGLQLPGASAACPLVHLRIAHIGTVEQGSALLTPMRSVATPLLDTVAQRPFTSIAEVHEDPTTPIAADKRGGVLTELTDDTVSALLTTMNTSAKPVLFVELRQLGGAFHRYGSDIGSVGHRDAAYSVYVVSAPIDAGSSVSGSTRLLEAIAPWAAGGVPVNFLGSANAPADVARAWDADTHHRLIGIKQAWDPDNMFRFGYPLIAPPRQVSPEAAELLRRCQEATSVAELAASLGLPLGVVRVLLADLVEAGMVNTYRFDPERAADTQLLGEVLDELRKRV
ncbi:DUF742 domain-containing protein [Sciscionella marina]|uniref:DUF742 domain-containing protein n=1 Tax=Sciscionella marina TaxID=508770 RepID=UPI000A010833|nr:DUF742 domain-containing protein [Sciscionella marina]